MFNNSFQWNDTCTHTRQQRMKSRLNRMNGKHKFAVKTFSSTKQKKEKKKNQNDACTLTFFFLFASTSCLPSTKANNFQKTVRVICVNIGGV